MVQGVLWTIKSSLILGFFIPLIQTSRTAIRVIYKKTKKRHFKKLKHVILGHLYEAPIPCTLSSQ